MLSQRMNEKSETYINVSLPEKLVLAQRLVVVNPDMKLRRQRTRAKRERFVPK